VDDNATNRRILADTLSGWGMRPEEADGANAALETLAEASRHGESFALALIDLVMPEIDGFELAERINRHPHIKLDRIIMLTSGGRRGDAVRCQTLGISAYLVKPIKQSDLFEAVVMTLQRRTESEKPTKLVTRHALRENQKRLHVLVAEDNPVNQKLAAKMLEKMGHTFAVASNGQEALRCLEREKFDLILMDVQMPVMDGIEATKAIRDHELSTGTHIPIVAMTAYAMKGDKERCLEAGMDDYVSKPINPTVLFETIEKISLHPDNDNGLSSQKRPVASYLDLAQLLQLVEGDKDLLKELISLFMDDCPGLMSEIRDAANNKDCETLGNAAHSLKGSVSIFSKEELYETALSLEREARNGNIDLARKQVADLERQIGHLQNDLISLTKELGHESAHS
ncbi:MAG: response regulator, partial [Deltaproteobacteria bacterium]|nr:response regulator [Deltaproteobacteria bacterium]